MKKNVRVVIDLGNSQTRVVMSGKDINGVNINEYFTLPNVYSVVSKDVDRTAYDGTDSVIFDVIAKDGSKQTLATGKIGNEYTTKIQPTGLGQKYLADTTRIGLSRVMVDVINRVAKLTNMQQIEVFDKVALEVFLMVPPMEVNKAQEELSELLKPSVTISESFPEEIKGDIEVVNVKILNEGLMGFVAASLDYDTLQPRQLAHDIRRSRCVVLDIGAGTTEVLVVDKNTLIETSRTTMRMGCINIINQIKQQFEAMQGFSVPMEDVEKAAITGYLKVGRTKYDVIDLVNQARKNVAGAMVTGLNSYLSSMLIPLATVEDIGFNNVDEVIDKLMSMMPDTIPSRTMVQIRIENKDKDQKQDYTRMVK